MSYCPNCGAELLESALICINCSVPTSFQNATTNVHSQIQRAPKSVGGFACGLLGFILDWIPLVGLALSIIGVVVCESGKKEVRINPATYGSTGLLTAGQVLGIIGIVAGSFVLIIAIVCGVILDNSGFCTNIEEFLD